MKIERGFQRLSIQIAALSLSMILLSFFTETQIWLDYFNYDAIIHGDGCYHGSDNIRHSYPHHHWNYRGWVYFLTGIVYFGISIAKILLSNNSEDFKRS